MKSKKVLELTNWLGNNIRNVDKPRQFTQSELEKLTEIAEIELSGNDELLTNKVIEFKSVYGYKKPTS